MSVDSIADLILYWSVYFAPLTQEREGKCKPMGDGRKIVNVDVAAAVAIAIALS